MKYSHLLFDADDTLFDFPQASSKAFSIMCQLHEISCTRENRRLYDDINQELWSAFDRGEVSKDFVTLERYVRFLKALNLHRDPIQCNHDYLKALGECTFPLPHAETVCRTLWERGHQMYIVTNAVASVQRSRLAGSVFSPYFLEAFISEDAGAAKPSKAYFDYVRSRVPAITAQNTLVIGDSLSSDIRGANHAGLPCCWFNPHKKARPANLRIDYEITDLRQLLEIV